MTTLAVPDGTLCMFSCGACGTNKSTGTLLANEMLLRIADSTGNFYCFIVKIGTQILEVKKGYYGYSAEKSIFQVSQEEGEAIFGPHVCSPDPTPRTPIQEGKFSRVVNHDIVQKKRRERGAVYLPGDGIIPSRKYATI